VTPGLHEQLAWLFKTANAIRFDDEESIDLSNNVQTKVALSA